MTPYAFGRLAANQNNAPGHLKQAYAEGFAGALEKRAEYVLPSTKLAQVSKEDERKRRRRRARNLALGIVAALGGAGLAYANRDKLRAAFNRFKNNKDTPPAPDLFDEFGRRNTIMSSGTPIGADEGVSLLSAEDRQRAFAEGEKLRRAIGQSHYSNTPGIFPAEYIHARHGDPQAFVLPGEERWPVNDVGVTQVPQNVVAQYGFPDRLTQALLKERRQANIHKDRGVASEHTIKPLDDTGIRALRHYDWSRNMNPRRDRHELLDFIRRSYGDDAADAILRRIWRGHIQASARQPATEHIG